MYPASRTSSLLRRATTSGGESVMATDANLEEAIEQLQQLGLKEYEARCFVGLSRLSSGTAKTLSEITDVPRTRVYDAIRVLESKGLVEVHHSSPQRFRAVSIEEAIETLRDQYESRLDRVQHALGEIEPVESQDESTVQEVWSLNGTEAIENRIDELLAGATDEVVLVIGHEAMLTQHLITTLNELQEGVNLLIGAVTDSLQGQIQESIPRATTFVSGLEWLHYDRIPPDSRETTIGRLLLVDREALLVSSLFLDSLAEQAIYGEGFGNGLVVLARRVMAHGLIPTRDSGSR
jgi:sugar-specific transcriptional regulator TrmB